MDIVERLRQEAKDWKCGQVVLEAADEIERLRRQLDAMTECARARGVVLDTPAVRAALEQ